jgi:rod shape-determining protein MreB
LILGDKTVEQLKINLLSFEPDEKILMVRGKSLENGLPKSVKIRTGEVKEAVIGNINQIIEAAKDLLETSPPEVVDEIFEGGIKLAGGISQIKGIDRFIGNELKIKTEIVSNALDATVHGLLVD